MDGRLDGSDEGVSEVSFDGSSLGIDDGDEVRSLGLAVGIADWEIVGTDWETVGAGVGVMVVGVVVEMSGWETFGAGVELFVGLAVGAGTGAAVGCPGDGARVSRP